MANNWVVKCRLDRFRLEAKQLTQRRFNWSVTSHLKDIDKGDNLAFYVAKHGFVAIGKIKSAPYPGQGFDPNFAVDQDDVQKSHNYVDLQLAPRFFDDPLPWSHVANSISTKMSPGNPLRLSPDDWAELCRIIGGHLVTIGRTAEGQKLLKVHGHAA